MAVCPKGSFHIEGLYDNVEHLHLFERMLFDLTIRLLPSYWLKLIAKI